MLPPIPSKILRSTAAVSVCTAIDTYQNQTYTTYTVNRVHLQPTSAIVKTRSNTDQQLSAILFVDARHSSPSLDWRALLESAHDLGGDMRVTVRDVTYTVVGTDQLFDTSDTFHHWEIQLK